MDESKGAEALILALIYPLCGEDMNEEQIRAFNEAVDLQRLYSASGRDIKSRQAGVLFPRRLWRFCVMRVYFVGGCELIF